MTLIDSGDKMANAIGIDYTPAYEQGAGIGRYVRELIAALARIDSETKYKLFVAGAGQHKPLPASPGPNFSWHTTRLSPRWLARLWHKARIPYSVENWLGDIGLFHATDFVLPPVHRTTYTILTVHDLSFVHVPQATSPRLKKYLDRVVPRSVLRADHVLADSYATKDDLVARYHTPPEKITVLWGGVDQRFRHVSDAHQLAAVRARYGLGNWPFLLTVGTVQPRKNYVRLCEAVSRIIPAYPDIHLVIAGGKGWLDDPIYSTVARLGLEERIHFIGFVDDDDLPALYSMAEVVPYVSLYEGFGFPVLEAMACGTPVVASNTSSIPEVTGDAAILVDPIDVDAITEALQTVLASPALQSALKEKGLKQAAHFTWEDAARKLVEVYQATTAL